MFHSQLHKSNKLLLACAGFIVGICAGQMFDVRFNVLVGAAAVSAAVYLLGKRQPTVCIFAICGLACSLGMLRGARQEQVHSEAFGWVESAAGIIVREPELRLSSQRLVVQTDAVDGLVLVTASLQPRYRVGDMVKLSCELEQPEPFDGFRYDKYLERYGITAQCYRPSIHLAGRETSLSTIILDAKQRLKSSFQYVVAPPEQTIVLGALFGDKRAIPAEIMDAFRATGTSHLLVISGLHVSLLTQMAAIVLKQMRIRRRWLIVSVILFLIAYVFASGMQSSAIRAAMFGSAVLVAELFGRRNQSLRLLVLAATGMLALNPLLLFYDAGFQLSFGATAGIIVFSKRFERYCRFIPNVLGLRGAAATSLSAIIATAPVIAYSFHQFSLIALPLNIILVPLMPIVLTMAVIVVITAICWPAAASLAGIPLYYSLHLMVGVVQRAAEIPNASLSIPQFSPLVFIGALGVVVLAAVRVLATER
ncbi:MAG: ComEC/Rec2 family competence protein [Candidatus Kerfeldbacteria bacterium]